MDRNFPRLLAAFCCAAPMVLAAQSQAPLSPVEQGGLDPATLLKPLADSWPTYSGDYSGRRYSALTELNQTTVKNLGLAWVARLTGGLPGAPGGFGGGRGGGRGGGGGGAAGVIVGGE